MNLPIMEGKSDIIKKIKEKVCSIQNDDGDVFHIGDIVSRSGDDRQLVVNIDPLFKDSIFVVVIGESETNEEFPDPIHKLGEDETNIIRRYVLIEKCLNMDETLHIIGRNDLINYFENGMERYSMEELQGILGKMQ